MSENEKMTIGDLKKELRSRSHKLMDEGNMEKGLGIMEASAVIVANHKALERGMRKPLRFKLWLPTKGNKVYRLLDKDGDYSYWFDKLYLRVQAEEIAKSLGSPCEFIEDKPECKDPNCRIHGAESSKREHMVDCKFVEDK